MESREKDAGDAGRRKPLPSGLKKIPEIFGGNFDPHDNSQNTVEVAILKTETRDHNLLLEKRGKLNILSLNISSVPLRQNRFLFFF